MPIVAYSPVRKALRGGRGRPTADKLEILGREMSEVVRADLKGSFEAWMDKANYDAVANAVYSGNWKKVRSQIPLKQLPDSLKDGLSALRQSMTRTSRISAKELNEASRGKDIDPASLSLTSNNPRVDEYLDTRVGMLVENVDENMQVNIQRAIRAGIDQNRKPEQVAQDIRQGLVLNSRQDQALGTYRAGLEAKGELSPGQIDKAVADYHGRLLDQRATMIARTETSYAQNASQVMVWQDAQEKGLLPDNAFKVWVVDGDPCLICQDLNGAQVRLDENFVTAVGDELPGPPCHPLCKCGLEIATDDG